MDPWVKPVNRLCDCLPWILYTVVAQTMADMGFLFKCNHSQAADKAVVDTRVAQFNKHQRTKAANMYAVLGGVIKQQTVESK